MPKCEPRHEVYDQVHIRLAPGSRFLRQLSVFIALDGSRFRQPYVKINVHLALQCEPRHEVHDQVHIRLAPGSRFLRQLSVFIALDGSRFR